MRRICIQSGHWNRTSGSTGAPGEQTKNVEIGKRLVDLLRSVGAEVYHTDANADKNPDVIGKDWDVFLALHCDMNYAGDEGGGFVDWIDPSIDSSTASNKESERVAKAIEAVYFKESGIRNVPTRRNKNTKFYYMWNVLSANTHCVIIEMGESVDPHDSVILNDYDRQAGILLRSLQNAYPDLKPVVIPTDWKAKYEEEAKKLAELQSKIPDMLAAEKAKGAKEIKDKIQAFLNSV